MEGDGEELGGLEEEDIEVQSQTRNPTPFQQNHLELARPLAVSVESPDRKIASVHGVYESPQTNPSSAVNDSKRTRGRLLSLASQVEAMSPGSQKKMAAQSGLNINSPYGDFVPSSQ